tara:strand:+ start:786 stop:1145 length:360 start_codon:yes stop_codon:yes gene_type:complete
MKLRRCSECGSKLDGLKARKAAKLLGLKNSYICPNCGVKLRDKVPPDVPKFTLVWKYSIWLLVFILPILMVEVLAPEKTILQIALALLWLVVGVVVRVYFIHIPKGYRWDTLELDHENM